MEMVVIRTRQGTMGKHTVAIPLEDLLLSGWKPDESVEALNLRSALSVCRESREKLGYALEAMRIELGEVQGQRDIVLGLLLQVSDIARREEDPKVLLEMIQQMIPPRGEVFP